MHVDRSFIVPTCYVAALSKSGLVQDIQLHSAASQGSEAGPGESSSAHGSDQLWEMLHDSIRGLIQAAPSANVLQSVKNLLEAGDVVCTSLFLFEDWVSIASLSKPKV